MNRTLSIVFATMVLAIAQAGAQADIIQSQFNTNVNVQNLAFGQSFTADSSVVNLEAFTYVLSNNAAGVTATAHLYDGQGFGGTLLDMASVTIPNIAPFNLGVSFDFTGNTLTPGNVYTVRVISDATLDLQLHSNASAGDLYTGGTALDQTGAVYGSGAIDFKFIVEGTVPEPASLAMLGAGGILCLRRTRK